MFKLTLMLKHGKLCVTLMATKVRLFIIQFLVFAWTVALASAPKADLMPLTSKELNSKIKNSGAKITIVNLWATWCDPCKEEMPELVNLHSRLASKGIELVLVSADSGDNLEKAATFLERTGVRFQTYRLAQAPDEFMKEFESHWPAILPTTIVFDDQRQRIGYWTGRVPIKELEKRIEKSLARLASQGKIGSDQKDSRKHAIP